jgi:hypothetical protein
MVQLSACIITRAEDRRYLADCLESLPPDTETVVVETIEDAGIGEAWEVIEDTATTRLFRWTYPKGCFSFARARNKALRYARGAWVLSIDTDERLIGYQHGALADILARSPAMVGGLFVRVAGWMAPADGGAIGEGAISRQVRVFRNHVAVAWQGRCHERVQPSIEGAGFAVVDTPLFLHHVGYEVKVGGLIEKARRNLSLLALDHRDDPTNGRTLQYMAETAKFLNQLME